MFAQSTWPYISLLLRELKKIFVSYFMYIPFIFFYLISARFNFALLILKPLLYLPPANEVWGKVIFLHLCVILFTGGGVPGQVQPPPPPGRYTTGQVHPPGKYTPHGQCADGMHPTGMHSCCEYARLYQ